ncbi:MAG: glycosyl transferase family protein [Parcubacteria group bacterium Gr01-1014_44]|nr:MAG: glycosyl transferase family protein [Parcubacteria group bacterium Gr01-1014_44]
MNTEIKRKRVLFVITQSEFGGAQRFLYNLISRLNQQVYDLKVAVGDTGNKEFISALKNTGLEVQELKWLVREINPLKDVRAVFELRKLIKEFHPDTLFLNSSKAGFIGSLAAQNIEISKYRNIKVIYRIGGWSFNDPWPWWKKQLWTMLEKISARWKDTIIVNNESDLRQAIKLKIKPREKVILIHNGLDIYKIDFINRDEARIKLLEKAARQSGKVFQVKTIIGTIANFYPAKGLEYLLKAAEHFKNNDNIIFVVIGDGLERLRLERLIAERGLEKKVLLLGQIPDASRLLPAFDIFLLPSVKEGFPWVLLEAMAAKLPVIATRIGAMLEIIADGQNGLLVEPSHPEQIVTSIQRLLENDHLKQELGLKAHQTVLFKFPLEKMIREIEGLL